MQWAAAQAAALAGEFLDDQAGKQFALYFSQATEDALVAGDAGTTRLVTELLDRLVRALRAAGVRPEAEDALSAAGLPKFMLTAESAQTAQVLRARFPRENDNSTLSNYRKFKFDRKVPGAGGYLAFRNETTAVVFTADEMEADLERFCSDCAPHQHDRYAQ